MKNALIFLSDFGLKERFVASMKGVVYTVDPEILIFDITHQVTPFNIWEGAEILSETMKYWPVGTVFVAVVDPGVGGSRKSVAVETNAGHYVVCPDNGLLTLVHDSVGIRRARQIDEQINRLPGSFHMHTFHGRDIYAYTGARFAAGIIEFEQVGPEFDDPLVRIEYPSAVVSEQGGVCGFISGVEYPYGNLRTNVPADLFEDAFGKIPSGQMIETVIKYMNRIKVREKIYYVPAFDFVPLQKTLIYPDSSGRIGLSINQGNFSKKYKVKASPDWLVEFRKED